MNDVLYSDISKEHLIFSHYPAVNNLKHKHNVFKDLPYRDLF